MSLHSLQYITFPPYPLLCPGLFISLSRWSIQPLKTCPWHHPKQVSQVRSEERQPQTLA